MIIPKHIFRIIEKLQNELETLFEKNPESEELFVSLQETKQIKKELIEKSGSLFEYDDEYIIMFNIMAAIYEVTPFNLLSPTSIKKIFYDCQVDPELEFALNQAEIVHPRMKNEVSRVISFLETAPATNWCQEDISSDYKIFKLVSKPKYDKIKEKGNAAIDLSFGFKYLKIIYVEADTSLHLGYTINKAKSHLIERMGAEKFYEQIDLFYHWFKLGKTGTYYIYVPR